MNVRKMVMYAIILLIFIGFPFMVNFASYPIYVISLMGIYGISALGLNILTGYGGQVSIGQASFIAIGAYSSTILTTDLNIPFIASLILSGLITAVVGFIIGFPSVKLSGPFLTVATLGFGVAVPELLLKMDRLTGGFSGLFPQKPNIFGIAINTDTRFYYLILIVILVILWLIGNLIHSKTGRAFVAVRESEIAAVSMGINVQLCKTMMFTISAFYTGISGSLYAHFVGYISPHDFSLSISFLLLAMIVTGGLASIPGSIMGAMLLVLIPQLTDQYKGASIVVTGVVMILVVLFMPKGMISLIRAPRLGIFTKGG